MLLGVFDRSITISSKPSSTWVYMLLDVFNCSIDHLLKAFKHIESTCFWVFSIWLIYNFLKAFKHMSLYAFECFNYSIYFIYHFLKYFKLICFWLFSIVQFIWFIISENISSMGVYMLSTISFVQLPFLKCLQVHEVLSFGYLQLFNYHLLKCVQTHDFTLQLFVP